MRLQLLWLCCLAGSLIYLSAAQSSESCSEYHTCVKETADKLRTCWQSEERELNQYRPRLTEECSRRFYEQAWWTHRLEHERLERKADCLQRTLDVRHGCPGMGVPWGAPSPVNRRRKRQASNLRVFETATKETLDAKLKEACSNADDVIRQLEQRVRSRHFTDRAQARAFAVGYCAGSVQLERDDIPASYGDQSLKSLVDIAAAHPKLQALKKNKLSRCANGDGLFSLLVDTLVNGARQGERRPRQSREALAGRLRRNCGRSRVEISADDLPVTLQCRDELKKVAQCQVYAHNCRVKDTYCDLCYQMSPLHGGVADNRLNKFRLMQKCSAK